MKNFHLQNIQQHSQSISLNLSGGLVVENAAHMFAEDSDERNLVKPV